MFGSRLKGDQLDVVQLSVLPKSDSQACSTLDVPVLPHDNTSREALVSTAGFTFPRFQGWKAGSITAASIAAFTLTVNVVAIAWLHSHPNEDGTLVELFQGDCHQVENMQIWSHLLINALGTLLLSGSNYCMQVLCAPTRRELDQAHAQGRWLDIGVPSFRNLWRISPKRVVVWWVLGLSSIPLHLLYNSAFYSSIGVANYRVDIVDQGFLSGKQAKMTEEKIGSVAQQRMVVLENCEQNVTCVETVQSHVEDFQRKITPPIENSIEVLQPAACLSLCTISSGEDALLSDYYYAFSNSVDLFYGPYAPFEWLCADAKGDTRYPLVSCETKSDELASDPSTWQPLGYQVEACYSQRIQQRCSFSGNISILAVVIVCNAIKVVCMLFVAYGLDLNTPLITVGDAVASYLSRPDINFPAHSLWSRKQFGKEFSNREKNTKSSSTHALVARRSRRRWAAAPSRARWAWTLIFLFLALIVVAVLLSIGYGQIQRHNTPISALGFGKMNPSALVNGWGIIQMTDPGKAIASAIIVANLPQAILSFLYLNLNGLVTSMWLSSEWLDYARERKTLRVSKPVGDQRCNYFLQLPYRVGVPLMVLSGVLHWLVSQSFFLAVVAEYNWDGTLLGSVAVATCGFSLIPMIIVMGIGVALIIGLIALGRLRKIDGRDERDGFMPLAGSCSAAIAAACCRPSWDESAALKPVMWGVVPGEVGQPSVGKEADVNVGHCSFSSGPVESVIVGKTYA